VYSGKEKAFLIRKIGLLYFLRKVSEGVDLSEK